MVERPFLAAGAVVFAVAAVIWGRSTTRLQRAWRRIRGDGSNPVAAELAASAWRRELHNTILYCIAAVGLLVASLTSRSRWGIWTLLAFGTVPVFLTFRYGRRYLQDARLLEERASLERRAEQVLEQEQLAPRRWAARLAPEDLPAFQGFEVGRVYEAGTGLMAGDFYDFFPMGQKRLAAVMGDVSGHGIEPSITAFQVKYLLRMFLQRFRDPAQALEELNEQLSPQSRPEEFVSLCVCVFDRLANTIRFASAGHPAAWLWHDGEVRPLRSTGPLLTLDHHANYVSREIELNPGDLLVLYTDGLAEARSGEQLFGEDRIAGMIRRDPGIETDVLCKSLLEAARDFADAPLSDDVAILAIRRT